MEECTEADPCTVEAVAREWPAAAQRSSAMVADHPADRGEHGGVALIRVGEHRAGARCGHVAGKQIAPRADRRAPPGAAVDRRDALHDVHHVCDRRLHSTKGCRDQQAVDPCVAQGGDDHLGEAAAALDFVGGGVDQIKDPVHSPLRLSRVTRHRTHHKAAVLPHAFNRLYLHHLISLIR